MSIVRLQFTPTKQKRPSPFTHSPPRPSAPPPFHSHTQPQPRIQFPTATHANNPRLLHPHRLRKNIDILKREVPATAVRVTLHDNTLCMSEVRQPDIIPARISHTTTIAGVDLLDRPREVPPEEVVHSHRRTIRSALRVARLELSLCRALHRKTCTWKARHMS